METPKKKRKSKRRSISTVNPNAAGIDVGATFHVVAMPPGRAGREDVPGVQGRPARVGVSLFDGDTGDDASHVHGGGGLLERERVDPGLAAVHHEVGDSVLSVRASRETAGAGAGRRASATRARAAGSGLEVGMPRPDCTEVASAAPLSKRATRLWFRRDLGGARGFVAAQAVSAWKQRCRASGAKTLVLATGVGAPRLQRPCRAHLRLAR